MSVPRNGRTGRPTVSLNGNSGRLSALIEQHSVGNDDVTSNGNAPRAGAPRNRRRHWRAGITTGREACAGGTGINGRSIVSQIPLKPRLLRVGMTTARGSHAGGDGQRWTEHFRSPAPAQATAAAGAASSSVETGLVPAQPSILMSSAEWRERMRLMLIARAISEEQWVMLANASIEDADQSLVDWQAELRRLTPQQFSALINRELETNPTLRQEAQAVEANWRSGNPAAQPAIGRTIRRSPSPGGGADTTGNCTSTPAGWFNDGSGRLRWWDGHQWTDRWG